VTDHLAFPGNPLLDRELEEIDPADICGPGLTVGTVPTKREVRDATRAKLAKEVTAGIVPGCDIYGLTKGQFDLRYLLESVLDRVGPADLVISTWTASTTDIERIQHWEKSKKITRARFILDFSFQRRKPQVVHAIRAAFGDASIRLTKLHCKFALISNARWTMVVRGSANLNDNHRIEDFHIADDPRIYGLLLDFVNRSFARKFQAL